MAYTLYKFGGTSVGDYEAIERLDRICSPYNKGLVIVVSAMAGITDLLTKMGQQAAQGDHSSNEAYLSEYHMRHQTMIDRMTLDSDSAKKLSILLQDDCLAIDQICKSIEILGEMTTNSLAKLLAYGERFLARILTFFLRKSKRQISFVDATDIIKMTFSVNDLVPDLDHISRNAQEIIVPKLEEGLVVIPGFIAEGNDGQLVTLGRGGSDYTATILGASLAVEKVVLYKEVDGLMTADPRFVSEARVLTQLHYREAAELAYFGAKVLHPRTIIPLVKKNIPLFIRNSFRPEAKGTRIAGDVGAGLSPVKALTAMSRQALISIEGKGMMGVPGMAKRAFSALAHANISVSLITQSSSESSICFTIPDDKSEKAQLYLKDEFRYELEHNLIEEISVLEKQSIIAVVGLSMSGVRGVAAHAFSCLKDLGVNVRAIAQGSSELNISVVIDEIYQKTVLIGLHRAYQLEKIKVYQSNKKISANIAVCGFGQIGQTLVRQIIQQKKYLTEKLDLHLFVAGLIDSSGIVVEKEGFEDDILDNYILQKKQGLSLTSSKPQSIEEIRDLLNHKLFPFGFQCPVIVDTTATQTFDLIKQAVENKFHIVLANKKPLAGDYENYCQLMELAKSRRVSIRYEATVGAGLPILDTIDKLYESGDDIISIEGCLSGTLGYIFSQLDLGSSFSEAVSKSYNLGYTEPDPSDDLSGVDVARKALILARRIGLNFNFEDISLQSVVDLTGAKNLSVNDFLLYLRKYDDGFASAIEEAKSKNCLLRYVARITKSGIFVGMENVASNSPLGRLQGSDNQVIIRSNRYDENPLIVTGPGAGSHVTAAGVLNDIIAISTNFSRN